MPWLAAGLGEASVFCCRVQALALSRLRALAEKKRKVEDPPGLVLEDVPPGEAWDDPDMLPVRDKLNPKASRALRRSFVFLPHALADHPEEEERQQQEEQEENEDVDSEQQREEERGGIGHHFQ